MKSYSFTCVSLALFAVVMICPSHASAQAMADYTSTPPFVSQTVPPNVLLLLDNSGSMNMAAYQTVFDMTKTYSGVFDPLECYSYGTNQFDPDPSANPASLGTCTNASYPWNGNLLNYVANRRIDIVKWVMVGGTCDIGRGSDGTCGRAKGQDTFDSGACCRDQTQSVTVAQATGRMPSSLIPGSGNVYFHMMGGTATLKGSFCVDNDGTQPSGSNCSDGDGYNETNYIIRVQYLQNSSGVIQQVGSKARFGLMEFKGAGDGGKVLNDVGGNITSMVNAIDTTTPATWTPLAESLYEATRYFAQVAPAYTNSDYSYTVTNRDPYYFQAPEWASTSQYVNCCKSFVIIFTDGEPTQDLNVPSAIRDHAHAIHGTHCTTSPSSLPCTPHKTDYPNNGSHYLDDVAYYAHTTDLRQGTLPILNEAGKPLAGNQNLIVYSFYAFGQPIGREILQNAAKAGGFEDRNGNNLLDLPEEYDRLNNLTGAAGADGLPDTYFESADADDLRDRLMAAITSILQKSSSGTSVSVLASSSTGEGALYQAFFYPSTFEGINEIKWTGYAQGLFLDAFGNLREDSDGDAKLILGNDLIVKTRLDVSTADVMVDRYADSNGDGKADSTTPTQTIGLKEMKPIWEAGKQLALMDPTARKILTWVDTDNDGIVDPGEQIDFTTSNSTTLAPYLRSGAAPYTSNNIINFMRGTQISGLRDRQLTVAGALKVWKLGDPIHSTPTVVSAPKERFDVIYGDASYTAYYQQYRERRQVAYVGANDGMLHAFNAGYYHKGDDPSTTNVTEHGWFTRTPTSNSSGKLLGEELWGFIPYQLLPHLQWLTRSDYTHVYYVDLKPRVTDARIFAPDADHPNGWATILIGGFRLGGSCGSCTAGTGARPMIVNADFNGDGDTTDANDTRTFYSAYFVLDITNPEVDPKLLWVFSDPSMGLSTSFPGVVRVSPSGDSKTDNTNAKWFAVFGSGPTGYDGSTVQGSKLYAINLVTGPGSNNGLVTTFSVGSWNSFMGDLITIDKDLDYRDDALFGGRVIHDGSLPWRGKMYRLTMGTCSGTPCTTTTWGVASGSNRAPTEVLDTFPATNTIEAGPITAAPTVTMDDNSKIWLFFGTGRYYGNADKTNSDTQYFFGVKDSVLSGSCTQTSITNCIENDLVNVSNATVCSQCSGGTNQVTGVTGVTSLEGTSTTTLQGLVQSKEGWYTTLPTARERVLAAPSLLGGIVFFPTFAPVDDICSSGGDSYLYALFYLTGSAYKESVIGTTSSGGNTNVNRSISLGTGQASQTAVQVTKQVTQNNVTGPVQVCSQSSTANLNCNRANTAGSVVSQYLSWINQRD